MATVSVTLHSMMITCTYDAQLQAMKECDFHAYGCDNSDTSCILLGNAT